MKIKQSDIDKKGSERLAYGRGECLIAYSGKVATIHYYAKQCEIINFNRSYVVLQKKAYSVK